MSRSTTNPSAFSAFSAFSALSTLSALKGAYKGVLKISLMLAATYLVAQGLSSYLPAADYRQFFGLSNRTTIWIIAELHLMFAAFVLGVPIFAVITEFVGKVTGEKRYDDLAKEFTRLLAMAYCQQRM